MAEKKQENGGCLSAFLTIIGVFAFVIIVVIVVLSIAGNNNNSNGGGGIIDTGTGKITYRDANNGDINGDWDSGLFDQKFVFIPNYDIIGLQFTFSIKDKNDQVIKQVVKNIGNVTKGQQYTVTLTTADLGDISTIWNAHMTSLKVTGGRVALF